MSSLSLDQIGDLLGAGLGQRRQREASGGTAGRLYRGPTACNGIWSSVGHMGAPLGRGSFESCLQGLRGVEALFQGKVAQSNPCSPGMQHWH